MVINWRFGSRKGAEASVLSTGSDLQPGFVSEGSLKFALQESGNDSGPSYRNRSFHPKVAALTDCPCRGGIRGASRDTFLTRLLSRISSNPVPQLQHDGWYGGI
jgi:hypothetical protein